MTQDNPPSQSPLPPTPSSAVPPRPPPGLTPQTPAAQQSQYPRPPSSGRNIRLILGIIALAIVVVGAACVLFIILPTLNIARERAKRVQCFNNLRCIGQALQLYANDNTMYPRTYYDPGQSASFTPNFTGGAKTSPSNNPFLPAPNGSVGTNNALAAMFLLVRTTDMNPEVFICPSSSQVKDTFTTASGITLTSNAVSNFTSANNVSYSFASMYPYHDLAAADDHRTPISRGYKWDPKAFDNFAIAADRNDGFTTANAAAVAALTSNSAPAQQRLANSRNHAQDGQNVLYNDGHVAWAQTMWVGVNNDGIYTAAKIDQSNTTQAWQQLNPAASRDTTTADPQLELDTVLLPKF